MGLIYTSFGRYSYFLVRSLNYKTGVIIFPFYSAVPCSMRDLSSLTRDPICPPQWKLRVLTTGPLGKSCNYFSLMPSKRDLKWPGCTFNKLFFLINLFIFGRIGSPLWHAGFLWLQWAGAALCCGERASHCCGFSCWGERALGEQASVVWHAGSRVQA